MPLGPFAKQAAGTDVAYARAGNCASQNGALVIQCQLDPVIVKITDIHRQSVFTTETIRGRPVGRWSSGRLAGWRHIRPTHVMTRSVRTSCQNQCSAHRKHQCRHFHRQTPFVKKHKNALPAAVPFSEQRDNTQGQQEQGVNHRDCAQPITTLARWRSKAQGKHNTGQALPDFTNASTPGMPVHPDSQGKTLPKRMQEVALNNALRDVSKGVEGNKNTKSPCIMLITQGHILLVLGLGCMGVNRQENIRLPAGKHHANFACKATFSSKRKHHVSEEASIQICRRPLLSRQPYRRATSARPTCPRLIIRRLGPSLLTSPAFHCGFLPCLKVRPCIDAPRAHAAGPA